MHLVRAEPEPGIYPCLASFPRLWHVRTTEVRQLRCAMGTRDITKLQSRGLDPRADLLVCVFCLFCVEFLVHATQRPRTRLTRCDLEFRDHGWDHSVSPFHHQPDVNCAPERICVRGPLICSYVIQNLSWQFGFWFVSIPLGLTVLAVFFFVPEVSALPPVFAM